MNIPFKLTADLSQDDVKAAIKMFVESQSGMKVDVVNLKSSLNCDTLDVQSGQYIVTATVTLVKKASTGPLYRGDPIEER